MKKNLFLCILSCIFFLCGCKSQPLIITDSIIQISDTPSVTILEETKSLIRNKPISKSQILVNVSIVEDNVYHVKCLYNNILIQEASNALLGFDENVTFNYSYVSEDGMMPYYLYTPSTAKETNQKFPLIVWLHGSGEKNVTEDDFINVGLPKIINEWKLSGFNAYIICPQLAGDYNVGSWNNNISKDNLQGLLDYFIENNNINSNKVIICGHSLGGQGALYMASTMPNYFKACIALSPYAPGTDINNVNIPILGYSEPGLAYASIMQQTWGESSLTYVKTGHGNVPNVVFNMDLDNDNKSDIIEWMFQQF